MIKVFGDSVKEFKHWVFPGGEVGVKIEIVEPVGLIWIRWQIENKSNLHQEFFIIANTVDAIRRQAEGSKILLDVPYLPYARQDRVCNPGESFALSVFENMLLSLDIDKIFICDLHSTNNKLSYRDNVAVFPQNICAARFDFSKYEFIIAPDAGAKDKAAAFKNMNAEKCFLITMHKVRKDGKVIHEPLPIMKSPAYNGIVVDDICDGGATFISVAKAVKENNPHVQLDLYVTHGIFSKGLDELKLHYNKIFCYNLMNLDLADQVEHIT